MDVFDRFWQRANKPLAQVFATEEAAERWFAEHDPQVWRLSIRPIGAGALFWVGGNYQHRHASVR